MGSRKSDEIEMPLINRASTVFDKTDLKLNLNPQ